jgi:hypothetical protein
VHRDLPLNLYRSEVLSGRMVEKTARAPGACRSCRSGVRDVVLRRLARDRKLCLEREHC